MHPCADRHVVVVGAGVAGLAAAYALWDAGVRVSVLEQADRPGGKLRLGEVGGVPVDLGAEAMLARRLEGIALARAVGLGGDVVFPATTGATVWTRGEFRPLPRHQVLGVPTGLRTLASTGLLTSSELLRVALDRVLPRTPLDCDVSVAGYLGARLGPAVVDRLVEPILGGVYAGSADRLSLEATMPQLAAAARAQRSVLAAARAARAQLPDSAEPVVASLRGGLGRLPAAVLAAAPGVVVRTGAAVRELRRTPTGWRLTVGAADAGGGADALEADAVVLAVPAHPAARLLRDLAPAAAAALGGIEHASVAVVTLAFRGGDLAVRPPGPGFLVPPVERRAVKAVTYSTTKWGWYAEDHADVTVVRLSLGRHGEDAVLQRDDDELVDLARADLTDVAGIAARPVDSRVTRWGGGLPQYTVGHLGRVTGIRAAVDSLPGLALCGAAYDGVGVAACVASGRAAAARVLNSARHREEPVGPGECLS